MTYIRRVINNPYSWWVGLIVILIFGAAIYLTGHDLGLPLYESKDERRNLFEVFALRDISNDELWKPGYPPGILYVNYAAQYAAEFSTSSTAIYQRCLSILNVRRIGIVVNLMSAILIALIARRMAGNSAGLIAMAAWLLSVEVIKQTQFGFPQTYELFSYLLAMYLALLAVDIPDTHTKPNTQYGVWAILSVVAGLLAVLFKYTAFPVLGLGVGASLWNLRRKRSLWLKVLGIQFALIALCATWLFLGYDALRLVRTEHVETNLVVSGTGLSNLTQVSIWVERYGVLTAQAGLSPIVYALILLIGSVFYLRDAKASLRLAYVVMLGIILLHLTELMVMLTTINEGLRQNLPVSGYSTILVTIAIISIARSLARVSVRAVGIVVGLVLVVFWLQPNIMKSVQYVMWRDLPVSQGELVGWAGITLPPEDRLLVRDSRPFSREWSCYVGIQHPHVSYEGFVRDIQSIIDLRNDDYAYVQIDEEQRQKLEGSRFGRIALGEMTLMVQFPPLEELDKWRTWRRGFPSHLLHVYTLIPMEQPSDTQFGDDILLRGFTIQTEEPRIGADVTLRFYWEALAPIAEDYTFFVNLISPDDGAILLSQMDVPPTGNPYRPTSTWYRAGEIMLVGRVDVPIPSDLQAGDYVLDIGFVNPETGQRLVTNHGYESMGIPITLEQSP